MVLKTAQLPKKTTPIQDKLIIQLKINPILQVKLQLLQREVNRLLGEKPP